jgi:ubiquitin C-terminal hydrolase
MAQEQVTVAATPPSRPASPIATATTMTTLTSDSSVSNDANQDQPPTRPGGIANLQNTCYMASALQMLASAEAFTQAVGHAQTATATTSSPLSQALLTLWHDLAQGGQAVHPQHLKQVMDERTCLFEGNEQQDAHEFLTTVLDLLDHDSKAAAASRQAAPVEKAVVVEHANSPSGSTPPASPMATEATVDTDIAMEEAMDEMMDDESPSCKRIKTCLPEEEERRTPTLEADHDMGASPPPRTTQSYSALDFGQIEQLLHGAPSSSRDGGVIHSSPATTTIQQPVSCRLVGGRMNPTPHSFCHSAVEASSNSSWHQEEEEQGDHRAPTSSQAAANNVGVERVTPTPAHTDETSEEGATTTATTTSSPVDDYFTTKVRARLTCDSCKYTRTHEETYLHWSLELLAGDDHTTSVEDMVRRFFAPERREVKCEKCFGEAATQSSQILQLPKMLLLHFKRFVVNVSPDYSSVSYEKNSSAVAFDPLMRPEEDLSDLVAPACPLAADQPYRLRSVVNHLGSSVSFGHYTADAHRRVKGAGSRREWLRFNDDVVSEISEQEAVQESFRTAYLVLYERE